MKCQICRVSNCETKLKFKGTVCAKHKWRMKKFGSYDLPEHIGEPNYYLPLVFPEGIVYDCRKHGYLSLDDCYTKMYKETPHYKCKRCIRDGNIRRNFAGMKSMECYENMKQQQNNVCKICNKEESIVSNNSNAIKSLAIDHCHKTGKVRGLLCQSCNAMLGYSKDSVDILLSAIMYLKSHQE